MIGRKPAVRAERSPAVLAGERQGALGAAVFTTRHDLREASRHIAFPFLTGKGAGKNVTIFRHVYTGMEKEVRWVFAAMIVLAILLLCWYFAVRTGSGAGPGVCSVQPNSTCGGY